MKWITRGRVKVAHVACPLLVRRFIDPDADIVRAADLRPSNPHEAGGSLRCIAHGFSALGLSDHELLDHEFIVYDALYAECQERVRAGPATTSTRTTT